MSFLSQPFLNPSNAARISRVAFLGLALTGFLPASSSAAGKCLCFTAGDITKLCALKSHSIGKYYRTGGGPKPARWRFFGVLTCGNAKRPGKYPTTFVKFEVQEKGFGKPKFSRQCALSSRSGRANTASTTRSIPLSKADYDACVKIIKDGQKAVGAAKWQ